MGKTAEGAVCYTLSPVHTVEMFISKARQLEDKGCRSDLHQGHGRPH